jgi:colanic acid biosynthesis glycosyl transferase WcaI
MPGVLYADALTPVLRRSSIGLVSQRSDILEFNLPSKLMNYMAHGIPVIASVNPASETARIVRESRGGWVTDAAEPSQFAAKAAALMHDRSALVEAGCAGFAYAQENFAAARVAERFEAVLMDATAAA